LRTVPRLGFGRRNVSDRFEQAPVVEPVHPLQRGELEAWQGV